MRPVLDVPLRLADGLSRDYLLHRRLAPKRIAEDGALVVAAAPDALTADLDDLALVYGAPVRVEASTWEQVERLIERLTAASARDMELARVAEDTGDELMTDARQLANQAPVIRYVNLLVREAYEAGASDIHLEGGPHGLEVRFRLDGVLTAVSPPPPDQHHAVLSRIKLLADGDIAERRRPQDGRVRVRLGDRDLDLRVSTVPTMHGESVVLRLLERGGRPVGLEDLGMAPECHAAVRRVAGRAQGMLVVTGPTGSGKTTTLYAALQCRDATAEKVVTVEDPIEYQLPHVTQVPLRREAGVTFGTALRAILRQDPDVLMIGEMRDGETAEIAVQAAMTGHMVFSTLHTNDAPSAVARLDDLGVPPYLVASAVDAVLGQRLVRRVCDGCRREYDPAPEALARLAAGRVPRGRLQRGAGCQACRGTGFRGRVGLFELLIVTDELREAIVGRSSPARLRKLAAQAGWRPLRSDGWRKVESGVTTLEEVLRVAGG